MAFDASDLGMSAITALRKNKVINDQQWTKVKKVDSHLNSVLLKALQIYCGYESLCSVRIREALLDRFSSLSG